MVSKRKLNLYIFSFLGVLLSIYTGSVYSGIEFSSRDSAIQIMSGSSFYNNSNNFVVEGTVIKEDGGDLVGNPITFNNGIFESNGFEALLSAEYHPGTSPTIQMTGGRLDGRPGTMVNRIYVFGDNNYLEGQAIIEDQIIMDNTAVSTLTVALQNVLSSSIRLNSYGMLILDDNLKLGDDVKVVGPGKVKLNGKRLELAGYYSSDWSESLTWIEATDIVLNGDTNLTGVWTFVGTNRINGNGHILNLLNGGCLLLTPGAILYLTDVHIRNLGDDPSRGSILMMDDTCRVYVCNTDIHLSMNYSTTIGQFYVDGPTTFILVDNDWTFSYDSKLTVDGITLWVDTLDRQEYVEMGQLCAPLALYALPGNLDYDLGPNGNLEFLNSGTVKICCDKAEVFPASSELLTTYSLTVSLTLKKSQFINPHEAITIGADVTINGDGAILYFAHFFSPNEDPQFIIKEGLTVTLKNITLNSLTRYTFKFEKNSKIRIAENVTFEFHDDAEFNEGTIEIVPLDDGTPHLFWISGMGGKRAITFKGNAQLLLGTNTLALDNIEFTGIDKVTKSQRGNIVGAIGLTGDTAVNVDDGTDMVFYVEGLNNTLRIRKSPWNYSGTLLFADQGESVLHIDFVLKDNAKEFINLNKPENTPRLLEFGFTPQIVLETGTMWVSSPNGIARLIFDDDVVEIINGAPPIGGFVGLGGEPHAYLGGNKLIISNNPARFYYYGGDVSYKTGLAFELDEVRGENIENGISPIVFVQYGILGLRGSTEVEMPNWRKFYTAIELYRMAEKSEEFLNNNKE